ncbi:hypothetical protein [Noviherbaspirillum sp. L7-7A]|uniref:hypothetical protein n=1 Tax=Noviherbaspirillum sp. L7-7A TaxID=2850560 RepID=UPI002010EAA6|nr:hypothetical protein [Noviherbaspirillum sp. L7-7A]
MSEQTRRHVDMFWWLLDEILNAVLFVLIGLEIIVITNARGLLPAGLIAIGITLLARLLTVGLPIRMLRALFHLPSGAGRC